MDATACVVRFFTFRLFKIFGQERFGHSRKSAQVPFGNEFLSKSYYSYFLKQFVDIEMEMNIILPGIFCVFVTWLEKKIGIFKDS